MIQNEYIAFFVTALIAVAWLRLIDTLANRGVFPSNISRKVIHIGTGPIFVLCWLLFPDKIASRYLAAIIPLLITMQFLLVGLGILKDEKAVKAMSRSGDRREILKGPLIYGLVFVIMTIVFWRDNMVGMLTLMILCGGDGMADLIGSQFGAHKLPWAKNKSWQGSIAMFLGAFLLISLVIGVFFVSGYTAMDFQHKILPILGIILIATLVESMPSGDFDNFFVPLISVFLAMIWL